MGIYYRWLSGIGKVKVNQILVLICSVGDWVGVTLQDGASLGFPSRL